MMYDGEKILVICNCMYVLRWDYAPDPLNPDVLASDWLLGHSGAFSLVTAWVPMISSLQPRSPPLSSSCLILSKAEYRDEDPSMAWLIRWLIVSWKGFLGIITLLLLNWGWIEADVRGRSEVTALSSNETQFFWLMVLLHLSLDVLLRVCFYDWLTMTESREGRRVDLLSQQGSDRCRRYQALDCGGKSSPKSGAETREMFPHDF